MAILGRITVNEVDIFEVDSDPSGSPGLKAKPGSLALYTKTSATTGELWIKSGVTDTAWNKFLPSDEIRARTPFFFGYAGSAATGRWLENTKIVASNTVPYVLPEKFILRSLSLRVSASATGTVTVFKNGVALTTISLAAVTKNVISGLDLNLVASDELSAQVTSGPIANPLLVVFAQCSP